MPVIEKIAHHFSGKNRHAKWDIFLQHFTPSPDLKVLDVGFTNNEYSNNDNFLEKHYPYSSQITALGVETAEKFSKRYPSVNVVTYDGSFFPFEDGSFDLCWCNAVIEHVGNRNDQRRFLKEISRICSNAWITTPNLYFPVEVHTRTPLLHMINKRIFDKYLCVIGKKWATGDYMNLLSRKTIEELLDAAGIHNYRILNNRLFGFVMEYIIIIKVDKFV